MTSGVAVKVPGILDFGDVTPDELVVLAQGLSMPDDLPLLQSRCLGPRYLQDQIMRLDGFVTGLPIFVTSLVVSRRSPAQLSIRSIAGSATEVDFSRSSTGNVVVPDTTSVPSLSPLDIFRVFPRSGSSNIVLDLAVDLSVFSLGSCIVTLPLPARANNSRGSTKEHPVGMNLILWMKVDPNLVVAKSPIGIYGVQQNRVVLCGELGNPSPLMTSKSLEGEEQDEQKRELFEEAEARREDGPLPVDPRDPQAVVWRYALTNEAGCERVVPHFR